MSKVEHGLAGRLAGCLPFGVQVTRGVVNEILPIDNFKEKKVVFLSVAKEDSKTKENGVVVLYEDDIRSLDIKPGDGVEVRRLFSSELLQPAEYLEKKEEGAGEQRKERRLVPGGEITFS